MKLLYIKANGFKNLKDDCIIDFVAKSKKSTEDKEYELQEIAEGLCEFLNRRHASDIVTIELFFILCYNLCRIYERSALYD